ncbi:MAG: tRNA (adenosine(37)-N6)-threonylcarbamoyltransferase complex transferase subunit TsaD [Gammaproteobacteria bacterium]|nr:tRNA (adenosine(37)-N6)-threonylcarbamoyltransferase complex transferase subunit TsaD [Gammaproteobacteria bacterium]
MNVLGIESSCDETAVAIYSTERGILSETVYTQVVHSQHGGVVPELAARDHIRKCLPLVQQNLTAANLTAKNILGIAYTRGPGLIGALMVGASVAHSLGYAWQVPVLGVHHMEAHLLVTMMEYSAIQFPFIGLLISGGHTLLVLAHGLGKYELLGESIDDAVGEAFDKTAKLLGLPYPGGAALAELAKQGDPKRFEFPRPMTNRPGLDFSFSGLKTHALQCYKKHQAEPNIAANIACAFQDAVVDTLVIKCQRALEQTGIKTLLMVGGVSANQLLRQQLAQTLQQQNVAVFYPSQKYCTDNATMVAYTGALRLQKGEQDQRSIRVLPRWSLIDVS